MSFLGDLAKFGGGLMRRKLGDMQTAWNEGTPDEKLAFQSSVSSDSLISDALTRLGFSRGRVFGSTQPQIVLPSGNFTNTSGAFALGTALTLIPNGAISGGGNAWVYLPAGAGGLTGGWYAATFSSQTVGRLVGNPTTTATAWTQSTSAIEVTPITIPGGVLGPEGIVQFDLSFRNNNSASSKSYRAGIGGVSGAMLLTNTTVQVARAQNRMSNRSLTTQTWTADVGASATAINPVDTASQWQYRISIQLAAATDWAMIESSTALATY